MWQGKMRTLFWIWLQLVAGRIDVAKCPNVSKAFSCFYSRLAWIKNVWNIKKFQNIYMYFAFVTFLNKNILSFSSWAKFDSGIYFFWYWINVDKVYWFLTHTVLWISPKDTRLPENVKSITYGKMKEGEKKKERKEVWKSVFDYNFSLIIPESGHKNINWILNIKYINNININFRSILLSHFQHSEILFSFLKYDKI